MSEISQTNQESFLQKLGTAFLLAGPLVAASAAMMVALHSYLPEWTARASWILLWIIGAKLLYQKHSWQESLTLLMLPVMPGFMAMFAVGITPIEVIFKSQWATWLFAAYYLVITASIVWDAVSKHRKKDISAGKGD